jgi:hypothetical protein
VNQFIGLSVFQDVAEKARLGMAADMPGEVLDAPVSEVGTIDRTQARHLTARPR